MLQDHYDNYKSIEEIERVEQEHLKVLEEFNYKRLVNEFVVKLKQIVEDTEAPRWLLKQSAVHTDEKGLKVLVASKNVSQFGNIFQLNLRSILMILQCKRAIG